MRLPKLSRRDVLGGASAAPLVAGWTNAKAVAAPASDPTIAICQKWLAVEDERQRLMSLWAKIEARLMKEHRWYHLSEAEQRALPDGRRLSEIHAHLEVLFEEREALLDALPLGPATSVAAVITRLSVVERLIFPEDHPVVHDLIVRSIRDLTTVCDAR